MLDHLEMLLTLSPADRAVGLGRFLGGMAADAAVAEAIAANVAAVVHDVDEAGWRATLAAMAGRGDDFAAYPPDATVRRLTGAFLDPLVADESSIDGLDHLDHALARARAGERILVIGNHLSYADTATMVHLLRRFERDDAADRVAVLAGPKVFSDAFRRFASAAVTTLKVAQSSAIAHNEAALSPRDIAKIARRSLTAAEGLMAEGKLVLLYAEGTRSRDGRLQPFLKATARYAATADAVLPLAHHGADQVMPVGDHAFHRAGVHLAFGSLVPSPDFRRAELLAAVHARVASGLPESHRPVGDAPSVR